MSEKSNQVAEAKAGTLTNKDITNLFLRWYFFMEAPHSYERMQGVAVCAAFIPILKKICKTKEKLTVALKRQLAYFNTQGIWGSPIHGIVASMEEKFADSEEISDEEATEAINGIKVGFMGPLAGIGDTIDWGTLQFIFIGIAMSFATDGNGLGSIIPLLFPAVTIAEGLFLTRLGYRLGAESLATLLSGGKVKQIISCTAIIGLFMMGALAGQYVSLTTPLAFTAGGTEVVIQNILDAIIPGLLPLLAVFGVYWVMKKKTQNVAYISLGVVGVALLGSLIGIF